MCLAQSKPCEIYVEVQSRYRKTGETTGIQVTLSFFWEMPHKLLQSASINIVRLTFK